jgi:hypothetical protein
MMELYSSSYDRKAVVKPELTPKHISEGLTCAIPQVNITELQHVFAPPTPDPCLDTDILVADKSPTVLRFWNLLSQSKFLIDVHGPHTSYIGTTVFSRAPLARDRAKEVSNKDFAVSLAVAQDCAGCAQLDSPAKEDLASFTQLWESAISALEKAIETGDLGHEILGWGVFGLSAGYISHASWREDSLFLSLKTRLHSGLLQIQSMNARGENKSGSTRGAGEGIKILARANREVHVCAHLLLQQFKREEWKRIRWYNAVAVAQKWINHLKLK